MPKKCSNYNTVAFISHGSRVMLKLLQPRLQQYVNYELQDVQAGFKKGRGTRDQIVRHPLDHQNSMRVPENIYFCFIDYAKVCGSQYTVENSEREGNTRPPDMLLEKPICRSGSNS